jgi:hypothetical protein
VADRQSQVRSGDFGRPVVNPPAFTYMLFLRELNASFRPMLGDDEIVAGATVVSGPAPGKLAWLGVGGGALLSAAWAALHIGGELSHFGLGRLWGAEAGAIVPPLILASISTRYQKTMLIAVSRRSVIVSRRGFRRRFTHTVVAPVSAMRFEGCQRTPRRTSIGLDMPGTGSIRLHAVKSHRAEIEQVLAAAHAVGVPLSTSAAGGSAVFSANADTALPPVTS